MPATNTQACVKQVASKDSMEPAVVKCAEDARNAVSYTHLTLPTICSV